MTLQHGRIAGSVKYREGDGVDIEIPQGPCEIEITGLDATLSWQDGQTRGSAAIPLPDYHRYVNSGALVID